MFAWPTVARRSSLPLSMPRGGLPELDGLARVEAAEAEAAARQAGGGLLLAAAAPGPTTALQALVLQRQELAMEAGKRAALAVAEAAHAVAPAQPDAGPGAAASRRTASPPRRALHEGRGGLRALGDVPVGPVEPGRLAAGVMGTQLLGPRTAGYGPSFVAATEPHGLSSMHAVAPAPVLPTDAARVEMRHALLAPLAPLVPNRTGSPPRA
jgi:hypothetical protein